jgi:hypothetical protein
MRIRANTKNDLDNIIPGLASVWKQVREREGIRTRNVSVSLSTQPEPMYLNDGYMGCRYGLSLKDMSLSMKSLRVSSGEWACHGGSNNDGSIGAAPDYAVVDVVWNDYHSSASMRMTLHESNVPKQLMNQE